MKSQDDANRTTLMKTMAMIITLGISFAFGYRASAVPVLWSANGHYYDFIAGVFTWHGARADASSMTLLGAPGHLVNITSAAENAFIDSIFNTGDPSRGAWIGGYEPADDGVWRWADGPEAGIQFSSFATPTPPFNYANWGGIEPSNTQPPDENYVWMNIGAPFPGVGSAQWADSVSSPSAANPVVGYLVEFETASVPDTGSGMLLLLIGMSGLVLTLRGVSSGAPARNNRPWFMSATAKLATISLALTCVPATRGFNFTPAGPEFQVHTTTVGAQGGAAIAMDGAGNSVIVWGSATYEASTSGQYGQRFDSAGNRVGPEFKISDYVGGAKRSVAMGPNGEFVVTWDVFFGYDGMIVAKRFDASGNSLPPPATVPSVPWDLPNAFFVKEITPAVGSWASEWQPAVAMDANGNFVIAWEDRIGQDGDAFGIFANATTLPGMKSRHRWVSKERVWETSFK